MTKKSIIEKTIKVINQLPKDKAEEISDFVDFIFKRFEESEINYGIQELASKSKSFDFLKDEEELYTLEDLKVVYNA